MSNSMVHYPLLATGTRTATTTAGQISIPASGKGIYMLLECDESASPQTLQIEIQRITEGGNARRFATSAAAAVAANSQMSLLLYPAPMSGSGSPNPTIRALILPPGAYQIRVLHSSTGAWTYRLDGWLLY